MKLRQNKLTYLALEFHVLLRTHLDQNHLQDYEGLHETLNEVFTDYKSQFNLRVSWQPVFCTVETNLFTLLQKGYFLIIEKKTKFWQEKEELKYIICLKYFLSVAIYTSLDNDLGLGDFSGIICFLYTHTFSC